MISFMLHIWMKLVVLLLMMNLLTTMTMMMILMMILDDDIYSIYKIPKASFKWVPDLGTSPGHEPINIHRYPEESYRSN